MGCCYLEAELCGLLPEEVDLLLAVSLLIVFRAFVDVVLTILQHAIDQSGEPMSHAVMAFGAPSLVRKRRYWAPR